MKKHLISITFFFLFNLVATAQHRNFSDSNPPHVTEVSFDSEHIILNHKIAYKYERIENHFVIKDKEGQNLIEGDIENIEYQKFWHYISVIPHFSLLNLDMEKIFKKSLNLV